MTGPTDSLHSLCEDVCKRVCVWHTCWVRDFPALCFLDILKRQSVIVHAAHVCVIMCERPSIGSSKPHIKQAFQTFGCRPQYSPKNKTRGMTLNSSYCWECLSHLHLTSLLSFFFWVCLRLNFNCYITLLIGNTLSPECKRHNNTCQTHKKVLCAYHIWFKLKLGYIRNSFSITIQQIFWACCE